MRPPPRLPIVNPPKRKGCVVQRDRPQRILSCLPLAEAASPHTLYALGSLYQRWQVLTPLTALYMQKSPEVAEQTVSWSSLANVLFKVAVMGGHVDVGERRKKKRSRGAARIFERAAGAKRRMSAKTSASLERFMRQRTQAYT